QIGAAEPTIGGTEDNDRMSHPLICLLCIAISMLGSPRYQRAPPYQSPPRVPCASQRLHPIANAAQWLERLPPQIAVAILRAQIRRAKLPNLSREDRIRC